MKTTIHSFIMLLAACAVLTACDEDAGELRITIDTPTSAATYSTTATAVTIGGSVEFYVDARTAPWPEMFVTNMRTGKRHKISLNTDATPFIWRASIPDLQLGENRITATVVAPNDYQEASIVIIRTQ